jgi:hypothetical protein
VSFRRRTPLKGITFVEYSAFPSTFSLHWYWNSVQERFLSLLDSQRPTISKVSSPDAFSSWKTLQNVVFLTLPTKQNILDCCSDFRLRWSVCGWWRWLWRKIFSNEIAQY